MKRVLFTLSVAGTLMLSVALPVLAHGVIERAEPPVGSAVATAPAQVKLWFTEPVDPHFSSIEVYQVGSEERVDRGGGQLESDGALRVDLKSDLPPGVYRVTWRVFTPGDGHQTQGTYSFGVGVPAQGIESVATERTPLGDVVRFLLLSGQALLVGLAAFQAAVALDDVSRFQRALFWVVQFIRAALGLGLIGALYIQSQALEASVLDVLDTQWGRVWLLRAAMTVLGIIQVNTWLRDRQGSRGAAFLAGSFLLLTTSLTSHSAAKFGWLGVALDWLHLLGTSVWLGGVLCAAIALALGERKFLTNFSILAIAAVGLLVASGIGLGSGQVGTWAGLLLTDYGRTLLLKLAVVGLAFGLGAVNAFKREQIKLLSAFEAGLGLIVLLSAAILTNLPPAYVQPTDGAPTRIEQSQSVGSLTSTVTVWPARLGPNTVEVRLTEAGGEPKQQATVRLQFVPVTVAPTSGSVVSDLKLQEVGGGLYSASGTNLTAPGDWQLLMIVDETDYLNFNYSIGPDAAVRPGGQPVGWAAQAVGGLNQYAAPLAAGGLLLSAALWSWLAWRSLSLMAGSGSARMVWLAPGLLFAGAIWLWIKLSF